MAVNSTNGMSAASSAATTAGTLDALGSGAVDVGKAEAIGNASMAASTALAELGLKQQLNNAVNEEMQNAGADIAKAAGRNG